MDKKEMALAIARDVIAQIQTFQLCRGTYIRGFPNSGPPSNLIDAKEVIDKISAECKVCGIGALLISSIRLYNNFHVWKIWRHYWRDNQFIMTYGPAAIRARLSQFFDPLDIRLIECFFEGTSYFSNGNQLGKIAATFGRKYSDPFECLQAIMQIIIDNDGSFAAGLEKMMVIDI